MSKEKKVTITIDNRSVEIRSGLTILDAARQHNIYIPSLCAMENLPSFGGCRMCIVEVDGLKGLPTACTTPVEEGMTIRTDSGEIKSVRQEILKLLLSEHPASCLFCDEKDGCTDFQGTIRKAGMTTGCRYCPKDGRCELQQLTESLGLTEISYPTYYRNFPVEKDDPFYDRDYNLCVLCGRCVRVCNEVRMNGTISFKQRGKLTTIGPALNRSHIEAGCEFCGACVSVCPTGALSTKTSKWCGKPDSETATTCPLCAIGCRLLLQTKGDMIIDALPDYGSPADHGLLCVKGRFTIPELVNSGRLKVPEEKTPEGYKIVSWERAEELAIERLAAVSPRDFLMIVSPQLSNEDLFAAQHLARQAMGSENIVSKPSVEMGDGFALFLQLASTSDPIDDLDEADLILLLGFDSRYGYSPIGVQVKRAAQRGVKVVSLNEVDTNLDVITDHVFKAEQALWGEALRLLLQENREGKRGAGSEKKAVLFPETALRSARDAIGNVGRRLIVAGPATLRPAGRDELLGVLTEVKQSGSWKVVMAHSYTNLLGLAAMGALAGVKPGEAICKVPSGSNGLPVLALRSPDIRERFKIIYVVGETLPDWLPPHDFLIYQNAFRGESAIEPDLILPSALFPEAAGSMISGEGKLSILRKTVEPPEKSRPDHLIIGQILSRMGKTKISWSDTSSLQAEMRKHLRPSPDVKKRMTFVSFTQEEAPGAETGGRARTRDENGRLDETYRGLALSSTVLGIKQMDLSVDIGPCLSDRRADE